MSLIKMKNFKTFLNFFINLPKNGILFLITAYQTVLSPDHSWLKSAYPHGFCRFYPSCSQYSKEAIIKYGLIKGSSLTIIRLAKCHPWAEPKHDLVP
jgi:putative membrane protein insertion efficiency factor